MFTDMVGYTALMQEDENLARIKRKKHRESQKSVTEDFNGQILQYFGDGTLIIFDSAVDAVLAGIEIQKKMKAKPEIPLRIGIHTGDIVIEDDGVYGDGVNLASRIESLCTTGSIFISEKVNDEINNQQDISTKALGLFELKNVKKPLAVFSIIHESVSDPNISDLKSKQPDKNRSIAVLPFLNLSGVAENEFFSDGITEEILNALTRVKGLQVTSRTSSFAFKNSNEDIRAIAKTLGVKTVLEGSVRRSGEKVRITAQLINSEDGYHYWSETFDRELSDIFAVQDEVSQIIASKLESDLDSSSNIENASQKAHNIESYKSYLQGMYHFYKFTPEDGQKAIDCFEESIKLDPEYGPNYAGIASALTFLGATGQRDPQVVFVKAEEMANTAIRLSPSNYLSYVAIGVINLFYKWNYSAAKQYFEKAISLNPSAAEPYSYLGWYYLHMENYTKQLEYQQKANDLNPLSIQLIVNLAQAYFVVKDYENAINQYKKVLELDPNNRGSYEGIAWVNMAQGKTDLAIKNFKKYRSFLTDPLKGWTGLGFAYGKSGQKDKAKEALSYILERQKIDTNAILEVDCAIIYAGLDDLDTAFEHLENALTKRLGGLIFLKINPVWEFVRKDPRFKTILEKFSNNKLE
jgi:TolB-like protein/Tfp pilus assembly protein PilF